MIQTRTVNRKKQAEVTFSVPADLAGPQLSVVGDFNDWDASATPMSPKGATLVAKVRLDLGRRYAFRYVRDDGMWLNDETADEYEPNEFGSDNCIVDLSQAS
jgi:1,4-alpha-glucan branching enzyme